MIRHIFHSFFHFLAILQASHSLAWPILLGRYKFFRDDPFESADAAEHKWVPQRGCLPDHAHLHPKGNLVSTH